MVTWKCMTARDKPDDGRRPTDEQDELTQIGGWWQPDEGERQPEKRQHARVDYSAMLRLVDSDAVRQCEASNISIGGVLLRHDGQDPPPVGQLVELMLTAPSRGSLTVEAEVVRHDPAAFAVRFMNVTSEQREVLQGLVAAAADGAASAGDTEYALSKPVDDDRR